MSQVLLVDDDVDLRMLLSSALAAHELTVFHAGSAEEARRVLSKETIALMIVDERLPDGSGEKLIRSARERGFSGKVVFYSAFVRDQEAVNRLTHSLDVAMVLYKPVAPIVFARRMTHLLGGDARSKRQEVHGVRKPLAKELDELEQGFAERLPHKLAELGTALHRSKSDASELARAKTLAHRLRGTAGSYGYQDVGDLVGGIEDMLTPLLSGTTRREFIWENVDRSLRDAIRCAQSPPTSLAASRRAATSQRHSLLVIDDDIEFLRLIRTYARRHSLQVITAQNVEEGVELASNASLSAALLDIHVDDHAPREVVERIRATPGNQELPVFFTSIDGSLATRVAAIQAGAARFLDKPLSDQKFSEMVQQVPFREAQAARIVILDDDEIVLEKYESELRAAGYFVRGIADANALIDTLEDVRPDVLLMDVNLQDVSGIDICRALRCSERWQFFPILMFSGDKDADMRVRAYQAGASDVLGKPLSVEELMMRVSVQAERIRMIREHSDRDSLSGLMLRRAFVEALQRALAASSRENKPLALILFDLDHFKQINDRYGHLIGDRVIAAFGELLRRHFRMEDLRGRWGGEEFVLSFPGQSVAFARTAAERLLVEFSKMPFETETGGQFHVTFTAGISVYPEDGESLDLLVKKADELLYEGKAEGRGRIMTSTKPELSAPALGTGATAGLEAPPQGAMPTKRPESEG